MFTVPGLILAVMAVQLIVGRGEPVFPHFVMTRRLPTKQILRRKSDDDRAIADFNEGIRLDPKNAAAFNNRGLAHMSKSDNDRAFADFNEAIRLNPNFAAAFIDRGVAYARKGDNNRAIVDYNEAIRLDPKNALAFCNRGRAKLQINETSGNADIAKARELDASSCR